MFSYIVTIVVGLQTIQKATNQGKNLLQTVKCFHDQIRLVVIINYSSEQNDSPQNAIPLLIYRLLP